MFCLAAWDVQLSAEEFKQANLAGSWSGLWVTPATKFTYELEFTIDEEGNITGTYGQPGKRKSPGLGGKLTLEDAETGKIAGTLTFVRRIVFQAQDEVFISKLSEEEAKKKGPLRIKGIFTTDAFPGKFGIDDLDVYGGTK